LRLTSWLGFLASLAVAVPAFSVAAGKHLEILDPDTALMLNPLSADTRIAAVVKEFGAPQPDQEGIIAIARRGLAFNPADARLYSLIGLGFLGLGETDKARTAFDAASRLLPSEVQALAFHVRDSLDRADYAGLARALDQFGRRWGGEWSAVGAYAREAAGSVEGLAELEKTFSAPRADRVLLLTSLMEDPSLHAAATRLAGVWLDSSGSLGLPAADRIRLLHLFTGRLAGQQDWAGAQDFHRRHAVATKAPAAGERLWNHDFSAKPDGTMFDWQTPSQRGVSVALEPGNGVRFAFLDAPSSMATMRQHVKMAPGAYRLTLRYEASALKGPEPVSIEVRCVDSGRVLGAIPIPGGSARDAILQTEFNVPATDCPAQVVLAATKTLPESWQNRYSGTLSVQAVSLQAVQP
jgi:hypothetical protein